jgi:hypothetical protein
VKRDRFLAIMCRSLGWPDRQTVANFIEKASRLYERERRAVSAASPVKMCVSRRLKWAEGGVWVDGRGLSIIVSTAVKRLYLSTGPLGGELDLGGGVTG